MPGQSSRDGGPAFPSGERLSIDAAGRRDDRLSQPLHDGMSLRDWFAGQALAGFLASPHRAGQEANEGSLTAAMWSYDQADAMLAARGKAAAREEAS